MKKIVLLASLTLIVIAFIASCKKQNAPNSGGTWVFHNQTYTAPFCSYVLGALTASTENNTPAGSIAFYFYDGISNATFNAWAAQYRATHPGQDTTYTRPISTFPPKLGSYKVAPILGRIGYTTNFSPDSGYVYIQVTDTSVYNYWVVSGSTIPSVTVSRVNTSDTSQHFYTVTLPPVMVVNINNDPSYPPSGAKTGTDSSLVSGTIIQTQ